jgi:putative regulator of septum formation
MKSWAIYIAAALGFVVYGAVTDADRDSSGAIVGGGTVDAFQIQVGDCYNDSIVGEGEYEVSDVPGVPCSDPHDNEAYAVFDLTLDSFPQGDAMGELANASCLERFESFVGRDYETSTLDISLMYPSPKSWQANDREVICSVYDVQANKLIGSAAGRGL